jgi:uncharacterized membrane protein YciS (DUF1049 family)
MKKETLIAVIFGVGLGILLAVFFVLRSKENQLTKAKPISNLTKTITPKLKLIEAPTLELTTPVDKQVVASNTIKIQGKANKNALIIINSPIKELVFKNDKENFSVNFPLALGENVIQLTVYPDDKTGSSINKTLQIYYLTNND